MTESQKPIQPEPTKPDEAFTQAARAQMIVDAEKRRREQLCGQELDGAIQAILKKNKCVARFMELREGGQTTRIWLQPVAQDELMAQPNEGSNL